MPGAVRNRISIINVPAKNAAYVKSSHFDTKNVSIWDNSNLFQNVLILPDHEYPQTKDLPFYL